MDDAAPPDPQATAADTQIARLVTEHGLAPHPEGGYYRRIFTSAEQRLRGRPTAPCDRA